jgi:hypothetical protein
MDVSPNLSHSAPIPFRSFDAIAGLVVVVRSRSSRSKAGDDVFGIGAVRSLHWAPSFAVPPNPSPTSVCAPIGTEGSRHLRGGRNRIRCQIDDRPEADGTVNIRMMGQTPAYRVRGEIGTRVLAYPLRSDDLPVITRPDQVQNAVFLGSTHVFMLAVAAGGTLDQSTIDKVQDGKSSRIYVWGRVDYEDVFAQPHWFTFCYF